MATVALSGIITPTNVVTATSTTTLTNKTIATPTITGVTTFSAGTAALPALTTSGDTNTGVFFPAADSIATTVGGAEGMRLTSTGLGIGTSSPAYKLDVQTAAGLFQVRDLGGSSIKLINSTAGGNIGIDSAGGITLIYANGTETARFNGTGALVLQGGTTSANGVGITFPATQSASSDANTLDDYEEGTWTPVINGDSSAGTGTYTTQVGTYTKVGRLVYIRIALAWSAHTGTGNFYGTGLPFTASSGSNTDATMAARTDVMTYTAGGSLSCKITQGNTTWWPTVSTNGNNAAAITVDSAAGIYISGCYEI